MEEKNVEIVRMFEDGYEGIIIFRFLYKGI